MEKKKISKWVILVTLAIGFIMATVDASIMNVAVSTIQTKLFITSAVSTWIVDAYLLSFASLLLFGGTLANKYGSKRIYLIGLIIFIVGSIFGGFSQNGASLISSRFFQGIGATLFMPSSLSLLIVSFKDPKERATMIGLWSAIVSISSGIGPFIGGSLIALLGWQSIFFINVPIGIVGYVLAKKYIGDNEGDKELTLTILPNILSMLMLGAFAFTLIEGGMHGWSYKPLILSLIHI